MSTPGSGALVQIGGDTASSGQGTCTLDRRAFVAAALAMVASGACATVAAVPVGIEAGRLSIPLRNYPGLSGPGGFLKLLPEGRELPVYLLANGEGGWVALSPVCTHQGCIVDVQGAALVCPCHGSTYDREGQVLRGPAEQPLTRYPVREEPAGTLIVEMVGTPLERSR